MKTLRLLALAPVIFYLARVDGAYPWSLDDGAAANATAYARYAAGTLALGLLGIISLQPSRR